MAIITQVAGAGTTSSWHSAATWDLGRVPTAADNVETDGTVGQRVVITRQAVAKQVSVSGDANGGLEVSGTLRCRHLVEKATAAAPNYAITGTGHVYLSGAASGENALAILHNDGIAFTGHIEICSGVWGGGSDYITIIGMQAAGSVGSMLIRDSNLLVTGTLPITRLRMVRSRLMNLGGVLTADIVTADMAMVGGALRSIEVSGSIGRLYGTQIETPIGADNETSGVDQRCPRGMREVANLVRRCARTGVI